MTETGDETRPPPTTGTAESAAWFRAELEALGLTQSGLAKWLQKRGDDRKPTTIFRHVQRMANGEVWVSSEMRVILSMMRDGQRKATQRKTARAAAAPTPAAGGRHPLPALRSGV